MTSATSNNAETTARTEQDREGECSFDDLYADVPTAPQPTAENAVAAHSTSRGAVFCSGLGQFHTDEPGKVKRRPYNAITFGHIREMCDNPPSVPKGDAKWFIPSTLLSRNFEKQEADGRFGVIASDLDKNPRPLVEVAAIVREIVGNAKFEIYASRSATEDKQKGRILIELPYLVDHAEMVRFQKAFATKLAKHGIEIDTALMRPAQLVYLPNKGDFYASFHERGGEHFDARAAWASEIAALADRDAEEEAEAKKAAEARAKVRAERLAAVGGDAANLGPIERYNLTTDISTLLLKHNYEEDPHRPGNWRHPASESGNYSLQVTDAGSVYGLSSDDPLGAPKNGGHALSPFDVLTILEYDGDEAKAREMVGCRVRVSAEQEFAGEIEAGTTKNSANADPRWNFKPLDMGKVMREDPKPIKWLFHQRVPGNRGALLTGLGGTSKTQMLYQMAIAAIIGQCPWGWNVDATGKAVLILTEDDENDPHITIHTIKGAMGLNAEQCRKIEDNLIIYPLAGEDLKLMIRDSESGALVGSGYLKALEELIEHAGNVAFVGIDPALGVTDGDEASQSDQRALGRMADNLAVRCDCSVFILTHGTKGSLQSDEITSHSSRGGGAITDAVRAEYGMRTMTVKEAEKFGVTDVAERESYVQLKATKGNRIPPEAKVPVWFRRGRGGFLETVELVEGQRGGISPLAKRVLDTMIEMDPGNNGVRLQDWRHRCIEKTIIGGPTEDALKKAMGRAVKNIGNRIKKKEGERGVYLLNNASFDADIDDDIEDAA